MYVCMYACILPILIYSPISMFDNHISYFFLATKHCCETILFGYFVDQSDCELIDRVCLSSVFIAVSSILFIALYINFNCHSFIITNYLCLFILSCVMYCLSIYIIYK